MANFLNVYEFVDDYINRYGTPPPANMVREASYRGAAPEFEQKGINRQANVSAKEAEARIGVAAQQAQTEREKMQVEADLREQAIENENANQKLYAGATTADLAGKGYSLYSLLAPKAAPVAASAFNAAAVPSATALPTTSLYASTANTVAPYLATEGAQVPMAAAAMETATGAATGEIAKDALVAGSTVNPLVGLFGAAVVGGLMSLFMRRG